MEDQANKAILDRNKVESDVDKSYPEAKVLLRSLVDYGTQLIPRAFRASSRRLEDAIVIGALLKQLVAMMDSFEILISCGAVHGAYLHARVAFETSLYIQWILASDTQKKARYYYVSSLRRLRLTSLRLTPGTVESDQFSHVIQFLDLGSDIDGPTMQTRVKQELDAINDILSQPVFIDVNAEFEKLLSPTKPANEPWWFAPLGKTSIRQIAEGLCLDHLYDTLYSQTSEVVHSSSYREQLAFTSSKHIRLKPIRILTNLSSLVGVVAPMVIDTYRWIIKKYRAGEESSFNKEFRREWKDPIEAINTRKVKYTVHTLEI